MLFLWQQEHKIRDYADLKLKKKLKWKKFCRNIVKKTKV